MKKKPLIQVVIIITFAALFIVGCKKNNSENTPPLVSAGVVSTDTVIDISQTAAVINSKIVKATEVTARGIYWGTNQLPTIKDHVTQDGSGGGSYKSSIKGLTINTKYYVRAYSSNASETVYGNVLSFNTLKPFPANGSIVKDTDGNIYHTLVIGNQVWLQENLKTTKYRNGDPILNITDPAKWSAGNLSTGAYSNYNNDPRISNIYGRLYNWYAVNDKRGLCPSGWHIPSKAEWDELINHLGGNSIAGGKLKEAGYSYWDSPNSGATNESGFTALPAGYREIDGSFQGLKHVTYLWSSTKITDFGMGWNDKGIGSSLYDERGGVSVRCTKDK